jgi:cysteine-rich repeat protein
VDLVNCTLVDSNGNIIAPSPIGTVGVGITSSYDPTNEPLICSDALEAGEPDTITVVCDCGAPASGLGTATATDEATFECLPICGDSNIDPGETCDPPGQPGPGPQPGECRADCTYCGDGIVDVGEECDDGNGVNYDGCNNNCEIETCDVLVDKSVDCGTGPVDMTLVSGNEDGTNGCSADNGDTIIVGYQVQNTGNVDLVNCTLTDSNGAIIAPGAIGTVGVSVTTPVLDPTNTPLICSDALELGEPDTITVSCDCGAPASGLGTASATDEADIECLPICGDGTVDAALGETCDPPGSLVAPVGGGAADRECRNTSGTTPPACTYCGDGIVQPGTGEECDDGNDINNDACTNDCTIPCQVLIDKTVAPDNGCDGIPDGAFEDSVSQAAGECVIYSICVTNSGYQTLDTTGVEVSDTHLGVTSLNLGTIAPGVTECVEIATEAPADSCTGPEGACVCEDVEGVNTAVVTNAVCETTGDNACDRAGSDCDDTAEVSCIAEGCLLIIDEDGIDNGMYNIERAAPACGLSMGDNDYLVNDKDWLYDENFYNPMDPLLFPSDLLSECRANGLPYDRKLPTECGNPAFLWNLFVGDC